VVAEPGEHVQLTTNLLIRRALCSEFPPTLHKCTTGCESVCPPAGIETPIVALASLMASGRVQKVTQLEGVPRSLKMRTQSVDQTFARHEPGRDANTNGGFSGDAVSWIR